jgi:hypothetical protein
MLPQARANAKEGDWSTYVVRSVQGGRQLSRSVLLSTVKQVSSDALTIETVLQDHWGHLSSSNRTLPKNTDMTLESWLARGNERLAALDPSKLQHLKTGFESLLGTGLLETALDFARNTKADSKIEDIGLRFEGRAFVCKKVTCNFTGAFTGSLTVWISPEVKASGTVVSVDEYVAPMRMGNEQRLAGFGSRDKTEWGRSWDDLHVHVVR